MAGAGTSRRADLVAWLGTLIEEYRRSEWHTHLVFDFAAAEQPLYVSFDINKFQQVINNLISNAIKFTPDGGGRIRVAVARQGEQAVIMVADTGTTFQITLPALPARGTAPKQPA